MRLKANIILVNSILYSLTRCFSESERHVNSTSYNRIRKTNSAGSVATPRKSSLTAVERLTALDELVWSQSSSFSHAYGTINPSGTQTPSRRPTRRKPLPTSRPTKAPSSIETSCDECTLTVGIVARTLENEGHAWTYNAAMLWLTDQPYSVSKGSAVLLLSNGTECAINLIIKDGEDSESKSVEITQNLVTKEKVFAVIGLESSAVAISAAHVARNNSITMISTTSTHPNVTTQNLPFAFRMGFTDEHQSYALTLLGRKVFDARNVAVIFLEDDLYSSNLAATFKDVWSAIASVNYYQSLATADIVRENLKTTLQDTLNSLFQETAHDDTMKIDIVFLPIPSQYIPAIVGAVRKAGWNGPIFGGDSWDDVTAIEKCGKPCIGAFYTSMWAATTISPTPRAASSGGDGQDVTLQKRKFGKNATNTTNSGVTLSFLERYRSMHKQFPNAMAALAYDALSLLAHAWKHTVSHPDRFYSCSTRNVSNTRIQLNTALRNISNFTGGVTSGTISFDSQNNPLNKCVDISYVSVNVTQTYFYSVCPRQ
jgi:ABC-type branched-subunit amino acid transport system substrate-binding protein